MADIHLKCPKCNAEMKVSEYISAASVPCSSCGYEIPVETKAKVGTLKLKQKPAKTEVSAEETAAKPFKVPVGDQPAEEPRHSSSPTLDEIHNKSVSTKEKMKAKRGIAALIASWIVFLVLGAAAFYWRWQYVESLSGPAKEAMIQYGLIGMGAAYLVCILIALKDNMFDGFLSIVVPGYAYYYIFMVSASIFIRAIVGAMFIGIGYDLLLFLQYHANSLYEIISTWIGSH